MAEEITNEALVEESPLQEATIQESQTESAPVVESAPPVDERGAQMRGIYEILNKDEVYTKYVPKTYDEFVSTLSKDVTFAKGIHGLISGDEVYSKYLPATFDETVKYFGLGKPSAAPSASVGGGSAMKERGAAQPSTPQPKVKDYYPIGDVTDFHNKKLLNRIGVPENLALLFARSYDIVNEMTLKEVKEKYGIDLTPAPTPPSDGGQAPTQQPTPLNETKPPSSLQKNELNGLRVPKYLYGMKAEKLQDPSIIRYTLSKLGVDMSEFTSDDISRVLESDYANAGDLIEDIALSVIDKKANPETEQPQEDESRLKQKFTTVSKQKPLVTAPEKTDDLFGFGKVVEDIARKSEGKEPNSKVLLATYEKEQQDLIDINKKIRDNDSKINDLNNSTSSSAVAGGKDYTEINRLKAENEELKKVAFKQTSKSNESLSKAQPVLDQYVSELTDGLKFKAFIREDGTLKTSQINDAAVKIAKQSGLSDEGVVVKYLEGLIGSRANVNELKPVAEGIFEGQRQKILSQYNQEKSAVEDAYKTPVDIENQARLSIKSAGDEISAFKAREADLVEEKYKSVTNQNRIDYDARQKSYAEQIDNQRQLLAQNQISLEEAQANVDAIAAQSNQETDALNKNNLEQFNAVQIQFNEINSKYNAQYKRRQQEIVASTEKLLKQDFEKYVKKTGFDKKSKEINEKLKEAYSDSWNLAFKNKEKEKTLKTDRLREDASFLDLLSGLTGFGAENSSSLKLAYTSYNNSLGSSIESLGDGMGLDWMRLSGKNLKDRTDLLSPAKIESWSDLLDFGNVVQLSGQLGGSMTPSLLATAGLTAATGSAGLGIGAQMVAGALAGFVAESTDMARRLYLDTVSSTGNAALGQERADKMWDFQTKMMWTYSLEAIPFIGDFWKGLKILSKTPRLAVAGKIALGGTAEYFTETVLQEFPQGVGEKAIMANRDAMTSVGEQVSRVKKYVFGDGVYANEQEKKEVEDAYKGFKQTAISTGPTFLFGAGGATRGALREYNENADIKKQGIAYYQKYVVSEAAPNVAAQQLRRLTMSKGVSFTGTMVSNLFAAGNITLEQRDALLATIDKTKTYINNAKQQKLKPIEASIYMTLADIHENAQAQVELIEDPIMKEASQQKADALKKELTDFLVNKETNLLRIGLADGESFLVTIDDLNAMLESSPDLIGDMADGNLEVGTLGTNVTKQQKELFDNLGERIKEHKAKAAPAAAAAEAPVAEMAVEDRSRKDLFPDETDFADAVGGSGAKSKISSYREVNGIGISEYTNPESGLVDVIMTGTSDNDYVGYVRVYEQSVKDGKIVMTPTNRWTSKMENKSGNKNNFKTMIEEAKKSLPENHEYTEKTNISLDGVRVFAKSLQKGYEFLRDKAGNIVTNNVELNNATLDKLKGAKTEEEVSSLYEKRTGITKEEFNKIKENVEGLIPNTQLLFNEANGSVIIKLPVLKSTQPSSAKPVTQEVAPEAEEHYDLNGNKIAPEVWNTASALQGIDLQKQRNALSGLIENYNKSTNISVSEAYHKAKADGSNPKLVTAVEELLAPKPPQAEAKPAEVVAPQAPVAEVAKAEAPEINIAIPKNPFDVSLEQLGYSEKDIQGMTMEQKQDIATNKTVAPVVESSAKVDSVKENKKQERIAEAQAKLDEEATSQQAPEPFPAQEGATAAEEKQFRADAELEQIYLDLNKAVTAGVDPNTLDLLKRNPTAVMVEKALREMVKKGKIKIKCK